MTVPFFYGIDFSGDVRQWKAGCRNSIVWIAEAQMTGNHPRLVGLYPVQDLPPPGNPFDRLAALLRKGEYAVAAIDAPFSIPEAHIPTGGRSELLRDVSAFPAGGRPFAKGGELVAYAEQIRAKDCKKPMRRTESEWAQGNVKTRSTLWNGRRGGAPFTVACLDLIQRSGRPCWPWSRTPRGLLAEAFPAGQLRQWNLPHEKYNGENGRGVREEILECIARRMDFERCFRVKMLDCADALDAVLCLFAAIAVAEKRAPCGDNFNNEGWIAVDDKILTSGKKAL